MRPAPCHQPAGPAAVAQYRTLVEIQGFQWALKITSAASSEAKAAASALERGVRGAAAAAGSTSPLVTSTGGVAAFLLVPLSILTVAALALGWKSSHINHVSEEPSRAVRAQVLRSVKGGTTLTPTTSRGSPSAEPATRTSRAPRGALPWACSHPAVHADTQERRSPSQPVMLLGAPAHHTPACCWWGGGHVARLCDAATRMHATTPSERTTRMKSTGPQTGGREDSRRAERSRA
jgi:hypothetical protein